MRRLVLAFICVLGMAGLLAAADVTLLKFDKETKEVTVKEGEAQKVYKITDATKFFGVDPDGNAKEMSYDDAVKGLGNAKSEGALKFAVTVKNDEIVEAKMPAKKRK
jgi:hypothetical protein